MFGPGTADDQPRVRVGADHFVHGLDQIALTGERVQTFERGAQTVLPLDEVLASFPVALLAKSDQ